MLRPIATAGLAALAFAAFGATGLPAAPPSLDALLPAGGQAGTGTVVDITGKAEPWPCRAWCSNPGVTLEADPENAGRFTATIAPEAATGPCLVRLFNDEGASSPVIFMVGSDREVVEDEAADHGSLEAASPVGGPLPLVVNGRLAKSQETDFYAVDLARGQTLHARLDAYRLRSPIDPLLALYDARGARLAFGNDDATGLDPSLRFTAPEDGTYSIAVMAFAHPPNANVHFHGDAKAVYRLHLGTSPSIASAVERPPLDETVPEMLAPPVSVTRALPADGTSARFPVKAAKGVPLRIAVEGRAIGSPIDGILVIEDPEGKALATVDDTDGSPDPSTVWTPPTDGQFAIVVGDRFHRGGDEFRFRLTVENPEPVVTASVAASEFILDAGGTAEIKLTVQRLHGHAAPLAVQVDGLPEGVSMEAPEVPENGGEITVKLAAASEAPPASTPMTVVLADESGATAAAAFRFPKDDDRGPFVVEEFADLWLTVARKPEPEPEAAKANGNDEGTDDP